MTERLVKMKNLIAYILVKFLVKEKQHISYTDYEIANQWFLRTSGQKIIEIHKNKMNYLKLCRAKDLLYFIMKKLTLRG